jgi:hypothetical protein
MIISYTSTQTEITQLQITVGIQQHCSWCAALHTEHKVTAAAAAAATAMQTCQCKHVCDGSYGASHSSYTGYLHSGDQSSRIARCSSSMALSPNDSTYGIQVTTAAVLQLT